MGANIFSITRTGEWLEVIKRLESQVREKEELVLHIARHGGDVKKAAGELDGFLQAISILKAIGKEDK